MKLQLTALLLLVGCATTQPPTPRVVLPKTAEAMTCYRECMSIKQACSSEANTRAMWGMEWASVGVMRCGNQEQTCLASCPGACTETLGHCIDLAGNDLYAPKTPAPEPRRQEAKPTLPAITEI